MEEHCDGNVNEVQHNERQLGFVHFTNLNDPIFEAICTSNKIILNSLIFGGAVFCVPTMTAVKQNCRTMVLTIFVYCMEMAIVSSELSPKESQWLFKKCFENRTTKSSS